MAAASAPVRKRTRLEYDERRSQILTASRKLFCERPYSEVSMADLAEAAGVARGLLHHYFGSKRDLYLAVTRQLIKVPTMPLPDMDGLDGALRWDVSVDNWMALIEANQDLWLTAIGAGGIGRDPELAEILDKGREVTAMRALEALGIDPASASNELRSLVRAYGGFAQEVTRDWLEHKRISRAEARALLHGALPLLVDQLLPAVVAASASGAAAPA